MPSSSDLILSHFPDLTEVQKNQFEALGPMYQDWNSKINVISRKDIDELYIHHVLHSLGIAKVSRFEAGRQVLDVGTGGGFPGIPLAILFPEMDFHLVDSIAKKIKVVTSISQELGLENVRAEQCRMESIRSNYDHIVCRAVAPLPVLLNWLRGKLKKERHCSILALKGGDLQKEIKVLPKRHKARILNLSNYFNDPYFETKKVVEVRIKSI